ncbi:response regulator [Pseudomonadota bacterium]
MTAKRILIVEDQGITAMNEDQVMRDLGYQVVGIAMTGEDAIKIAGAELPDVILMDIKLAGPMDGREAAMKIREQHDIPVIFVTAYGNKEQSKSLENRPPDGMGYVVKPFTQEELRSEIERLTG